MIKKQAEQILKRVQYFEYLRKVEQTAIKALYQDAVSDQWIVEGIEKDLGLDQSVSLKKAVEIYLNSCKKRVSITTVKSYGLALHDLQSAISELIRVTEIGKRFFVFRLKKDRVGLRMIGRLTSV